MASILAGALAINQSCSSLKFRSRMSPNLLPFSFAIHHNPAHFQSPHQFAEESAHCSKNTALSNRNQPQTGSISLQSQGTRRGQIQREVSVLLRRQGIFQNDTLGTEGLSLEIPVRAGAPPHPLFHPQVGAEKLYDNILCLINLYNREACCKWRECLER